MRHPLPSLRLRISEARCLQHRCDQGMYVEVDTSLAAKAQGLSVFAKIHKVDSSHTRSSAAGMEGTTYSNEYAQKCASAHQDRLSQLRTLPRSLGPETIELLAGTPRWLARNCDTVEIPTRPGALCWTSD